MHLRFVALPRCKSDSLAEAFEIFGIESEDIAEQRLELFDLSGEQQVLGCDCHDAAGRLDIARLDVDSGEFDQLRIICRFSLNKTDDCPFSLDDLIGLEVAIDQEKQYVVIMRLGEV